MNVKVKGSPGEGRASSTLAVREGCVEAAAFESGLETSRGHLTPFSQCSGDSG